MGIQGVVLEHHGNITIFRSHIIDEAAPNSNVSSSARLQSRDHSQRGAFATTARTNQDQKLPVKNFQANIVDDGAVVIEPFRDSIQ